MMWAACSSRFFSCSSTFLLRALAEPLRWVEVKFCLPYTRNVVSCFLPTSKPSVGAISLLSLPECGVQHKHHDFCALPVQFPHTVNSVAP